MKKATYKEIVDYANRRRKGLVNNKFYNGDKRTNQIAARELEQLLNRVAAHAICGRPITKEGD